MSSPMNSIVPAVGSRRRIIVRPSVDLPQPDSPTSPTVSPFLMSRSTPSTARTWATVLWRMPEETGNHVFSPRTDTSGAVAVQARFSCAWTASGTFELHARLGDPARGQLRFADPVEHRGVARAAFDLELASRVERTAGREVDQVGWEAVDRLERLMPVSVQSRNRPQQRPGVRMLGVREHVNGRARLDHPPRVHHHHALAHAGHHAEVVCDQDGGRAEVAVDMAQQVEDLGLDGDIQGGGRFVGDQDLRRGGETHRDHGPLAHPTGKLVRVIASACLGRRDAHPAQHRHRHGHRLGPVQAVMQANRLRNLPTGPEDRVQGRHRVLNDHRDVLSTDLTHLSLCRLGEVSTLVDDTAADDLARTLKAHDAQCGHRLTAARLADDAERLSGVELERYAIDRLDVAVLGGKDGVQVVHLEKWLGHRQWAFSLGSKASRTALPKRFEASTVTKIVTPGKTTSHPEWKK